MITRSKKCRQSYLFVIPVFFLVLFSSNALAIDFTVNTTNDSVDSNPGDRECRTENGTCSLRAAVQEANAVLGADVINLPAGLFPLLGDSNNEDHALSGDLDVLDNLTIRGAGTELTRISGAKNSSAVFSILSNDANPQPSVTIEQLAMSEGLENADGGVIYTEGVLSLRSVLVEDGGFKSAAVFAVDTSLTIEDSVFERNNISVSVLRSQLSVGNSQFRNSQFTSGAPVLVVGSNARLHNNVFSDNQGSAGSGAISAVDSKVFIADNTFTGNSSASIGSGAVNLNGGIYTLTNNVFSGNTSARTGGAISSNATMYARNNSFDGNVSVRYGGAIEVDGPNRVFITDSFFDSNNAQDCGAISIKRDAFAEWLVIENSIFRNNVSGDVGGALCFDNKVKISHSELTGNVSRTSGGAIYSFGGNSSVVNSTISGNLAVYGTAVYQKAAGDSSLELQHVTIADNVSNTGNTASIAVETGRVMLAASIVSAKGSDAACSGVIDSAGYNFVSDASCALNGQGDLSTGNAGLGGLVQYGTAQSGTGAIPQAHKPAIGSPVLEAVPSGQCLMLDQAYKNRTGMQCDIGAVQLNGTDVLAGVVKFGEPQYQVNEFENTASIKVSRVDGNFGAIGVHLYDTELGTAMSDFDYAVVNEQYLQWADGDASDKLIEISLYDDNSEEGNETIQLALAGASGGAAIGGMTDTVIVSIIDDETSQAVATTTDETPGSSAGNDTDGSVDNTSNGTGDGEPADSTTAGNTEVSDDQPGAITSNSEREPGTVITVGSARGGSGSIGIIYACLLLLCLGYRTGLIQLPGNGVKYRGLSTRCLVSNNS